MRARLALVVVLLSAAPLAARAQYYQPPPRHPRESGLVLGARLGVGFPMGDLAADVGALSDTDSSKIPIWLELGYRFNHTVRANLFLQLAPTSVKDTVCGTGSCSGSDTLLGADLQLHLGGLYSPADPWFGVGLAYESLSNDGIATTDANGNVFTVDETWTGGALVLEGGVDFAVGPIFTVGPYLGLTFGRFGNYSQTGIPSYSIGSQATHSWLELGVKGTFNL